MIYTHPFRPFVPGNTKYLILGSFAGLNPGVDGYDWYYATKRNQFWPILETVYGAALPDKASKQALFSELGIAVADIIYQCERLGGNALDSNLKPLAYNEEPIRAIFEQHPVEKVFFTSKYVERMFRRVFKDLLRRYEGTAWAALPSPSPRYARMRVEEKVRVYRDLLPPKRLPR